MSRSGRYLGRYSYIDVRVAGENPGFDMLFRLKR